MCVSVGNGVVGIDRVPTLSVTYQRSSKYAYTHPYMYACTPPAQEVGSKVQA
jgi:hypothetical protein